jgi:hypothetical protein
MNANRLSRRRFLRGVLGGMTAAVALPWLEATSGRVGSLMADSGAFPTRFGLFFWGNGVVPSAWIPTATGRDYELSYLLEPIAAIKDKCTLVSGTALKVPNIEPHWSGASGFLTGKPLLFKPSGGHTMPDATVDQIVAQAIGNDTRFRSIEFGARPGEGLSFNGPDNPNPPEASPFQLFNRVFGPDFREPGSSAEPDPSLRFRQSVLDLVTEDITRFERGLGASDRARLDQHLTSVREIETRLARLAENPANLEACRRPETPLEEYPDRDGRPQLVELNRAMCDIVALALACDQTRVFSNYITSPLNNLLLATASGGHHQLTHDEPGDQPMVQAVVRQIMGEFTYFVQSLNAIPEGDGTLLDHTMLLATTEISYGRTHALDEFPILIAGSAGGRLVQGTHIRSTIAANTNSVTLSLMRAVGVLQQGFGEDDSYTEDGFSELEV